MTVAPVLLKLTREVTMDRLTGTRIFSLAALAIGLWGCNSGNGGEKTSPVAISTHYQQFESTKSSIESHYEMSFEDNLDHLRQVFEVASVEQLRHLQLDTNRLARQGADLEFHVRESNIHFNGEGQFSVDLNSVRAVKKLLDRRVSLLIPEPIPAPGPIPAPQTDPDEKYRQMCFKKFQKTCEISHASNGSIHCTKCQ